MTTDVQLKAWLQSNDSTRVILVEVQNVLVGGTPTNFYLSNRPYADAVNGRLYTACISGGVSFSEKIDLSGTPTIGYGDIELSNPVDSSRVGERDTWLNYVWGNKAVTVLIGDVTWLRSDFYPVFTGLIRDIDSKSRSTLNLLLVDNMQRLNVAVSDTLLTGTFTTADKLLPVTFGECFNVTPLLVDPPALRYKVHTGQVQEFIEVRDNGAPLSFSGNSATLSTADGTFTLARPAVGTITCSVRGSAPAGSYKQYIGEIIRDILTNYGAKLTDAAYINASNFTAFDSATPFRAGAYVSARQNVLEVCYKLADSIGAYLVLGRDGKFKLTQVKSEYTAGTGTHKVSGTDMELNSFAVSDKLDVQGAIKLAYCKNWTVQSSGLAAGVVVANASIFARDYYYVNVKDNAVLSNYGQNPEPPARETLLIEKIPATTEADRLLVLYKTPRFIYRATYYPHMLLAELGDTIDVVHPRFGLASPGKTGTIVEINRDWLKGRVTLGVFI
jgi:hypothetical protein